MQVSKQCLYWERPFAVDVGLDVDLSLLPSVFSLGAVFMIRCVSDMVFASAC